MADEPAPISVTVKAKEHAIWVIVQRARSGKLDKADFAKNLVYRRSAGTGGAT